MWKKEKSPIRLKMKKFISKICAISVLSIVAACSSKEDKNTSERSDKAILQEVTEVKAIGKVIPAETEAIIASDVTGIVDQVLVKEGDSVRQGQVVVVLKKDNITLDVRESELQLQNLKEQNKSLLADIEKAEIFAKELQEKYETSKMLFAQNAETREKMDADYSSWQQQLITIKGLKHKLLAQQQSEREQAVKVQKSKNIAENYLIKAVKAGIITELKAMPGQHINTTEVLGKIINTTNPVIEAEVDELFANDIRSGQKVFILPIGRKDTLAIGSIFYTDPILSNKSILYESANESEDRRVRRIKINMEDNNILVINAKVDCIIQIK